MSMTKEEHAQRIKALVEDLNRAADELGFSYTLCIEDEDSLITSQRLPETMEEKRKLLSLCTGTIENPDDPALPPVFPFANSNSLEEVDLSLLLRQMAHDPRHAPDDIYNLWVHHPELVDSLIALSLFAAIAWLDHKDVLTLHQQKQFYKQARKWVDQSPQGVRLLNEGAVKQRKLGNETD